MRSPEPLPGRRMCTIGYYDNLVPNIFHYVSDDCVPLLYMCVVGVRAPVVLPELNVVVLLRSWRDVVACLPWWLNTYTSRCPVWVAWVCIVVCGVVWCACIATGMHLPSMTSICAPCPMVASLSRTTLWTWSSLGTLHRMCTQYTMLCLWLP